MYIFPAYYTPPPFDYKNTHFVIYSFHDILLQTYIELKYELKVFAWLLLQNTIPLYI